MSDLNEDVEDLCYGNLLCLVSIDTTATVISLSVDSNKSLRYSNSVNCQNSSSIEMEI
jgi:hypothetical protein